MSRGIVDIDRGWGTFRTSIKKAAGKSFTKVGFPAEATPKGSGPAKTMLEQVQIAAVHEFGAPKRHVPERSFLRTTYDENREKLNKLSDVELDRISKGESTAEQSLSQMGEWLAAKMKNKIRNRIPPELSPDTIKAKTVDGKTGDVPLIDTAQMIQSITHVEVAHG
jgi:hypothetical protein